MVVTVFKCPRCGDSWAHKGPESFPFELWNGIPAAECFKCGVKYSPYINCTQMDEFIFEAMKNCKGH
jgi:hypothetical protein